MLRKQLAENKFLGLEQQAVNRLLRLLPVEKKDAEEIGAEIRFYALEAATKFDPERGCRFTTFLYHHLKNRCRAMWKTAWSERRRPVGGFCEFFDQPVWSSSSIRLEMSELVNGLSGPTKQTFKMVMRYYSDDLARSFTKRTYKASISTKIGLTKQEVEEMVFELRKKIPEYISTVEA